MTRIDRLHRLWDMTATTSDSNGTSQMYWKMLLRVEPSTILVQPLSMPEGMTSKTLVINRINYAVQVGNHTTFRGEDNQSDNFIQTTETPQTSLSVSTQVSQNRIVMIINWVSKVEIIFGILGIIPLLSGEIEDESIPFEIDCLWLTHICQANISSSSPRGKKLAPSWAMIYSRYF